MRRDKTFCKQLHMTSRLKMVLSAHPQPRETTPCPEWKTNYSCCPSPRHNTLLMQTDSTDVPAAGSPPVLKRSLNSPCPRKGLDTQTLSQTPPVHLSQGIPQPSLDFQPKSCINWSLCVLALAPASGLNQCHVMPDTRVSHGKTQSEVPSS